MFSWQLLKDGAEAAALAPADPENTMQLALTLQELALVGLGLRVAASMFPELGGIAELLGQKILELSDAQDFL